MSACLSVSLSLTLSLFLHVSLSQGETRYVQKEDQEYE